VFSSFFGAAADSALTLCSGDSFKSQSALADAGAMVTGWLILPNPNISTVIVQFPSSKSGKLYAPCSSVVVMSFFSPWVAVTTAPGMGNPVDRTVP
jgi:hypothetical protein